MTYNADCSAQHVASNRFHVSLIYQEIAVSFESFNEYVAVVSLALIAMCVVAVPFVALTV